MTREQHGFEVRGSTNTWIFSVVNSMVLRVRGWLNLGCEGTSAAEEQGMWSTEFKLYVDFQVRGASVPLTLASFKDQLYVSQDSPDKQNQ